MGIISFNPSQLIHHIEMRSLLVVALFGLAAVALAVPAPSAFEQEWVAFKAQHGKRYDSAGEEALRQRIYQDNKKKIEEHNAEFAAGKHSFDLAPNHFADMLTSEFATLMNRYQVPKDFKTEGTFAARNISVPDSVDWRTKGLVTPVKNQGQCGSCWAFSTTGSMEGQHAKADKLESLSEQQLVDCSGSFDNAGCQGGLMDNAFKYIKSVGGLELEDDYSYTGKNGDCSFDKSKTVATLTGFKDVTKGDEDALKQASATVGPISVAIDASHFSFQFYRSGVYYSYLCSSTKLDHGVLVVGYGTEDGKDFWLVKNSWAEVWGLKGYIKMSRNQKNNCGIATSASYPTCVN